MVSRAVKCLHTIPTPWYIFPSYPPEIALHSFNMHLMPFPLLIFPGLHLSSLFSYPPIKEELDISSILL